MFILLVQVEIRPELTDEFRRAIQQNAARSREVDPGCLRFEVYALVEEGTKLVFLEVYTNEAAWQAHRRSPHFLAYQEVANRALVSRTLTRLDAVEAGI
jgi:quinol monooxygenase YgiN